jgi:cyclopropane-fatty-acyl-phospholipid synthase
MRFLLEKALARAGVRVGGPHPWDVEVRDPRFYRRVLLDGPFAPGEAYADGWWACPALDQMMTRVLEAGAMEPLRFHPRTLAYHLRERLFNLQRGRGSRRIAHEHYDLSAELFTSFLDSHNQYTCGYWKGLPADPSRLEEAQQAKMELICRKLGLAPGMTLLDVGCGWGGFARYAAEKRGARVVGVTISEEQARAAREFCKGLPVEVRLQDYRALSGAFDRVTTVGMIEHVGAKNYAGFMRVVRGCLKPGGLFLLHTITGARSGPRLRDCELPWIGKHIFPNSALPSIAQLARAAEGNLVLEDLHQFGADYDLTLQAWHRRFHANLPALQEACPRYDARFARMWDFYLLGAAACFRSRKYDLAQLVFSPSGVPGGYAPAR